MFGFGVLNFSSLAVVFASPFVLLQMFLVALDLGRLQVISMTVFWKVSVLQFFLGVPLGCKLSET